MQEDVRAWWDEEETLEEEPQASQPEIQPAARDFVHLHVHSEFSLLDGLSPVRGVVDEAKRGGMRAVALTDHGNLYGAVDFYSIARAQGIKPILGVEAYVSPRGMADKAGAADRNYFHLVLLAKNLTGYRNLLKLVSAANLEGYYYKPRFDRELLEQHAEGLIALSACYSGEPSRAILDGDPVRAREAACWYRERFGTDYFLELQDHGIPDDQKVNAGLLELSRALDIPIVATNDSHYTRKQDATAQDILLCIQTNSTQQDPKRMRMEPAEFYLKSPEEMWQLFGELPDALNNTLAIAERCDLTLEFGRLNFPQLDHVVPAGQTPQAFLAYRCQEGLARRYAGRVSDEHRQRLAYELDVVEKTGFAAYILFVWDFVDWARRQGITCGPRGSAAGSIILYCLGISDVDPVGYGLTFERFLNPERIQMPDIDMDFADDRRDEVIQYVVDRYGRDRVAQIITFGRLLARAAIRDVGRALDYPLNEVDRVAKLVPAIPIGLKIDQAIEQSPELKRLCDGEPHIKTLIDTAKSVEGVARHAGTHAAGVVVADQPLVNYVPLQKASRGDSVMTQYDMKVLDKIGLLKMDFLGLANLTMLAKALDNVRRVRGIEIDLNQLPLDDAPTYAMLGRGETRTVFQLEGPGMTRSVQELKPSTVDHLAALVALYRPGPMAHIPSYIARREGREAPTPPDPALEDVLRESYGIIVYQDQVLQVVRKLAGYSLGQADVLRRAMGKKEKKVMEAEGPRFIQAVVDQGYPRSTAEHVWELLQPFAGYAFNKAHAYCYALVAYQTAYLKANYPVEWFAAVLSTIAEDTDKVVGVINECRRMQIPVLPPDVNRSRLEFTVEDGACIRFGLSAIKNVGEGAVELLVAEQEANGPYTSLEDFCRRQDLHTLNKRVIESLVKCGAMDELGQREALLDSKRLDSAIGAAQVEQKAASAGQTSLFDAFGVDSAPVSFAPSPVNGLVPDVNPRERALWEKEVLGFQFGDHPFQEAAAWLGPRLTHDTSQVTQELSGEKIVLGGLVTGVRKIVTRTHAEMAILTLEDLAGSVEVVVFPRVFEKMVELCHEDKILVVEGKIDSRNEQPQIVLDRAEEWLPPERGAEPPLARLAAEPNIKQARNTEGVGGNGRTTSPGSGLTGGNGVNETRPGNGVNGVATVEPPSSHRVLRVIVPREEGEAACLRVLEQLHGLVERNPGQDMLELVLRDRAGGLVELSGAEIQVRHSPELENQVRVLVGSDNVSHGRSDAPQPGA
jgi:DNA polymerase III subunit alpha